MRNRISFFHCLKEKLLCIWYILTQNNPKTSQLDTFDITLSHERFARATVRVFYVRCEVTCIIIYHVSRVSHWLGLPHTSLLRYLRHVSAAEPYREDIKPDVTRLVTDLDYSDSSVWWDIMKTVRATMLSKDLVYDDIVSIMADLWRTLEKHRR